MAKCRTPDPVTLMPNATVLEATRLMLDHKLSGLPVMAHERVVGVITESDLFRRMLADASGTAPAESHRATLVCGHCGTLRRRRSFDSLGPDDTCWQCHYHLHRCESCRYFDRIACMLNRQERHTAVPGQHCQSFALLAERAANLEKIKSS